MNAVPMLLADIDGLMIPLVAIFGGFTIAIVGMVSSTIRSVMVKRQEEQTRREIAAYVAEGSMTPDEGARLIAAGGPQDGQGSAHQSCRRRGDTCAPSA